jgi:hypothetical protein
MDDKTKSVCVESYWMYVDKSFFLFSWQKDSII